MYYSRVQIFRKKTSLSQKNGKLFIQADMNEFGSKCRVIKLQIKKFTSFNTSGGSHNVDYAILKFLLCLFDAY